MSGHSKWASIKHKKATTDKKRSNVFGKLANAITVAARSGQDPSMNPNLQMAIDKAKSFNLPKDNIERAIKRADKGADSNQVEEIVYEIYGPSGVAILATALTDNKNRTTAEVKAVLNKLNGKMASSGAVQFLFVQKGAIEISIDGQGRDDIELKIIESGADDYGEIEGGYLVYSDPHSVKDVVDKLKASGIKVANYQLVMEPKEMVELPDEQSEKVIKLLEALDELDDVNEVNSNLG